METQTSVQIDGSPLMVDSELSFETVAESVKGKIGPQRVITEVKIGSRFLNLEEEDRVAREKVKSLESIEFFTRDVASLLQESLSLAPKICESLAMDCTDIQSFFATGLLEKAHERIGELSTLVDWLLQCIVSLQAYGEKNFKSLKVDEGSLIDSVRDMEKILRNLHEHMMKQDFQAFEELLMGDFRSTVQLWQKLFTKASSDWIPRA